MFHYKFTVICKETEVNFAYVERCKWTACNVTIICQVSRLIATQRHENEQTEQSEVYIVYYAFALGSCCTEAAEQKASWDDIIGQLVRK